MSSSARAAARLLLLGGRRSAGWTSRRAPAAAAASAAAPKQSAAAFASASSSPPSPPATPDHEDPLHEHLGGLEHIDVDVDRAAGVATLRLNRPRALNALSTAVCEEVVDVALRLDADKGVRALVVTGAPPPPTATATTSSSSSPSSSAAAAGADPSQKRPRRPVFAAGADIREMAGMAAKEAKEARLYQGWRRLGAVRMPLVAAVNGVALGGGFELALMCDVIIASEDAEFGLPEPTLGVIPLMGGTQRLARLAGRTVAMDVALTGRRLTAREALQWGVVSRVVPHDPQLGEEAVVLEAHAAALRAARLPARSVEAAKRAVAFAADGDGGLMAGLDLEERLFHECFETRDREEGMAAFLERRAPKWTHS